MTRAVCTRRAVFACALAGFGLGWSGIGAAVASVPMTSVAQAGAVYLDFSQGGLFTSSGLVEGPCARPLAPLTREQLDGGLENIQLAGPVRRSMRRTARRTSRRQARIHDYDD